MQTESVSSRDLSSPEGLRGNQTEYLRQASLIPLVRLKSHSHTHTPHTHTGPTHQTIFRGRDSQENRISLNLFACVHLCLFFCACIVIFPLRFHFRISKTIFTFQRDASGRVILSRKTCTAADLNAYSCSPRAASTLSSHFFLRF